MLRRIPLKDKPIAQEKGRAIKLELEEEEIKDIHMVDEDLRVEVEEVEVYGADPITKFLECVPPCKGNTKVPEEIGKRKIPSQNPLLPNEIIFEGPGLG